MRAYTCRDFLALAWHGLNGNRMISRAAGLQLFALMLILTQDQEQSMIMVSTCCLVLNENGELWLMRRTAACRDEHERWGTCSGRLEEGWAADANMRRELLEELNVTPEKLEFIGYRDVFRMIGAGDPHYVSLDFLARVRSEDVTIMEPEKHDQGEWFRLDSLPAPLHSDMLVWLAKYRQYLSAHDQTYVQRKFDHGWEGSHDGG